MQGPEPGAPVICDARALADPDLGMIEALAHLALLARRAGCGLEVHGACPRLRELVELTGLTDVVALRD